ncbi:MAG: hypothetical protein IT173_16055 [Acidobacteria bacterium]|nr:hypothetical protein [Acidobacteriota bacterium]
MMRKLKTPNLYVLFCTMFCLCFAAYGQEPTPEDVRQGQAFAPAPDNRAGLVRELGLSPEQVRAVVKLNRERKPVEDAARKRFRDAQRDLNLAIYGDYVVDSDVYAKLAEFQSAQAELARIKFANELAVRKLLTPQQLVRFRELRRRFAEERKALDQKPNKPANRALQRLRRRNPPINRF